MVKKLFVYNIVLIILCIILLPVIVIAMIIQPKFRAGLKEKLGFYRNKKEKSTIFHAVSVGEANAIKDLVREYKNRHSDESIVITTTTKTGQEIAKKSLSEFAGTITYFPFDFFFSVLSFFNTYNPEKIIIAETEIWPCFTMIAKLKGIKVYTVNGRISPHSYEGYKSVSKIITPVLNSYEKIFMQTKDDAQRIIDIGADKNIVEVMGNLKFDITQNLSDEEINKFKEELKTENYRVFITASTHKGEDEIAVNAFLELKKRYSDAKLLIAPRHPQRFDEVWELIKKTGLNCAKRSNKENFENNDIILLDTMGELSKLFSVCHIAFIGGSFSATGGHNPLEANIWGKPVISGNCTFNFKDVYKIVTDKKCAVIVNSQYEFNKELISFYEDSEKYKIYCYNAKNVFDENRGAINYVLQRI